MKNSFAIVSLAALLSILTPLACLGLDDSAWEAMKEAAKNRQRRLIYDNDGDDAVLVDKDTEKSLEHFLSQRTSYLAGSQVDTLIYTSDTWAVWNTEGAGTEQDKRSESVKEKFAGNYFGWFYRQGTTVQQVEQDFARQNGLEFFLSFRINDTHDAVNDAILPPAKLAHPEWLFGRKDALPLYCDWSSYDFAVPEVRRMFVDAVRSAVERYEVDGISIDIQRQNNLFKSVGMGGTASDEERRMLVEMFTQVRAITEAAGRRRQRPVLILMRIPDSVEYCHDMGLDLEALLKNRLVDLIVAGGNWRLNPWRYSVELCHRYGVKCYADIDMPEYNEPAGRLMRNSSEAHWAWQAAALSCGCDGTYWFNRFYKGAVATLMCPDLAGLKFKSKRYHATDRWLYYTPDAHLRDGESYMKMPFIHPNHPMELNVGQDYPIILEFGDDTEALLREGCSFEVAALLRGCIPQPEKLVLSSNGMEWAYAGEEGDCHTYEVPAGSLKPGENIVTIRYTGTPGTAGDEQVIMAGDVLLTGVHQAPWRRLFDGCKGGTSESIVENAYRLEDNGAGYTNLLYPLPAIDGELLIKGSMRLESSDGGEGSVLRVADGRHIETIVFKPGKLCLKEAGKSVAFDTTDAFHDYEISVTAEQMTIRADGKTLLEAPMATSVSGARAMLRGASWHMPSAATRSLLVGSLDNAGKGTSLWRNLRINRQNGRTFLTDFAVETSIYRPIARRDVQRWQHVQEGGAPFFLYDHPSWEATPMVAEADVDLSQAPVRLAFSRGASFAVVDITHDAISFPGGSRKPLKLDGLGGVQTIHVQFDDSERIQLLCGDFSAEFTDHNTTTYLRTPEFSELPPVERNILRNGGFAVLPGTDGTRNTEAVKAVRGKLFRGGEAFPAEKVQWRLEYDAAGGELPGSAWQSTYLPQNMELVDGIDGRPALRLTGSPNPYSQNIVLANPQVLNEWGEEVVVFECRLRYAGGLPEDVHDFVTFGLGAGAGNATGTLYVQLGTKNTAGNCGTIPYAGLEKGDYVTLQGLVDKKSCEARFWIDGELVGRRGAFPNPLQEPFFTWGKTSANLGTIEVSGLKLGVVSAE